MELFTGPRVTTLVVASAVNFWLTAFAPASSAQVVEYTHALRLARSAGDETTIESLERLTEKEPEFPQTYRALITIARRLGTPKRAEQHLQSLLNSPRAKPYAHYALALYYNTYQEHAKGESNALECLKMLPDFLPAYGELAKAASDSALRTRITKLIDDAIQTRPRSAGPLFARGMLHIHQGRWAEAIPPLLKADELEPDAWEILEALFFSYYRTDQAANALKVLDRALGISLQTRNVEREGIVLGRIGILQSDLGEYEKARTNLTRAVECNGSQSTPAPFSQ